MRSRLHHVAISTADFDWYTAFFTDIFGMETERTTGAFPARKIWFCEGIQLNELPETSGTGGPCDHISIAVPDIPDTVRRACECGCTPLPDGAHWFALPNGIRVELKPFD